MSNDYLPMVKTRSSCRSLSKTRGKSKRKYLKSKASSLNFHKLNQNVNRHLVLSNNVKDANSIIDLFNHPAFKNCQELKESEWNVKCSHSADLDSSILDWAFQLVKANVKEMYEATIGWSDEGKLAEMTHEASRYIFLYDADPSIPVAFSHFRFDMDFGEEVLYCYELHVVSEFRGKGLGSFILRLLELLAFTYKMSKVILTVFKDNEAGVRFYRRYGYSEDSTCLENESYLILSKYEDD